MSNLANPAYAVVHQDLVKLLQRHAAEVSAEEILKIACNMVGQLTTLQDNLSIPSTQLTEILRENLKQGVADALRFPEPLGTA